MSSAVLAVADGLTDQGLDVRDPACEKAHILKITSARSLLCEIIISQSGLVTWEYLPLTGSGADPAQVTKMIMSALGTDGADYSGVPPRQCPGLTLKGTVGRELRERGMQVRLSVIAPDDVLCEVYSDIEVMNPEKRSRGRVLFDDDGVIRWECRISESAAGSQGIEPGEIAGTIARVLALGQGQS